MAFTSPTKVLTPEGYCWIHNLEDMTWIPFQLMPDVVGESKNANYDQIAIVGRSQPILGYAHSGARTLNLSLEFAALTETGKYSPPWILEQVRWLEAKVYPRYDGGWVFPPPRLLVVIGRVIGLTCVMTSVDTQYMKPWHVDEADTYDAYPFRATVNCSFTEWGKNDDYYDHPYGHDEAVAGENQTIPPGGARIYYEIPTGV